MYLIFLRGAHIFKEAMGFFHGPNGGRQNFPRIWGGGGLICGICITYPPPDNSPRPSIRQPSLGNPRDYRHTDKNTGLVMTTLYSIFECNCLLLHLASRVPNINRYTPDFDLDRTFDLDLKAR